METATLMVDSKQQFTLPTFSKNLIIIVGGYGSGKSEVALNLARHLAHSQPGPVAIADLDIVNPYFRSREADDVLRQMGITPLNPGGGYRYADLPIILPEIKGAIERFDGKVILDVGGDDVGARVLSSLSDSFTPGAYELLLVVNTKRPFTQDVAGCRKLMREIEASSQLKFTGLISNTHLLTDTDAEVVLQGLELTRRLGQETGLPVVFVSVLEQMLSQLEPAAIGAPVLPINRLLLKPWERETSAKSPLKRESDRCQE
jgi:CheY-like chemotaxis protein